MAATVLVENVFAWPGLGSTIVQSILAKDYPVVQGIVLVYGLGVLWTGVVYRLWKWRLASPRLFSPDASLRLKAGTDSLTRAC